MNYLDRAKELFGKITIPEGDEDAAFIAGLTAAIVAMAEAVSDNGIPNTMSLHETTVRTLWSQYAYGQMSEDELKTRLALINEHLGNNVAKGGFMQSKAPEFNIALPKGECGFKTPNGPCIVEEGHLTGEGLPGDNGHLSQVMIDNIKIVDPGTPKVEGEGPGSPGYSRVDNPKLDMGSVDAGQYWDRPAEDANDNPPLTSNYPQDPASVSGYPTPC